PRSPAARAARGPHRPGPPRSALFELADAVAEAGRLLVGFLVDRLQQLLAQLDQLRLRLLVLRQPAGRLAAVPRLAVDVLQERRQLVAELLVVVRAAEAARVTEFHEFDPAEGAFAVQDARLVAVAELADVAGLGGGALLLRLVEVLVGTLLAQ